MNVKDSLWISILLILLCNLSFASQVIDIGGGSLVTNYYNVTNITNISGIGNITGYGVQYNVSVWANDSQLIPSPIWTNQTHISFWNTTPTAGFTITPNFILNDIVDETQYQSPNVIYAKGSDGPTHRNTISNNKGTSGGGFLFIGGTGSNKTQSAGFAYGGQGGNFSVIAGSGGIANSTNATRHFGGDGGVILFTSGSGGEPKHGDRTFGGAGGNIVYTAGVGGPAHNGTFNVFAPATGGTGGSVIFNGGVGGNGVYYFNNTYITENYYRSPKGGIGGSAGFTGGAGGYGSRGGVGGQVQFTAGNAGIAFGNDNSGGTGATGGLILFQAGGGEAFYNYTTTGSAAQRKAGTGGGITLIAGSGGISFVSATGWNYGGDGGSVSIAAGAGASTNGSGGNVFISGGSKDGSGVVGHVLVGAQNGVSNLAVNTYVPIEKLHVNGLVATQAYAKFTANTTTGVTATDGLSVGISATGEAQVRQYESNKNITFWTNNTQMFNITDYQPIVLTGRGTVYNDIVSPITVSPSVPNQPTFNESAQAYMFHDDILANQDYVYAQLQLPHGYKEDTNLFCHIHWLPTSSNVGAVNFSIEYTWTNYTATQLATTKISATDTTTGTVMQHRILSFPVITGTGKTISSSFKAKLMRESASTQDTFTGNAVVDFFDCHYEQDTLGSASEYGKWTG